MIRCKLVRRLCWMLPLVAVGCTENAAWNTNRQALRRAGERVFKVVCILKPAPWVSFGGDANPSGLKFNLYLLSRDTGKGILADGLLQARMSRKVPAAEGGFQRVELCFWTHDLADFIRSKRASAIGWGYLPVLHWGDTDIAGQDVEIKVWYEDHNGRRVYAQPISLKVPAAK
ncbi:MAG: hypothetical protein GY778_18155 [bacterium]|nr:hypothetical protein [bacterium]